MITRMSETNDEQAIAPGIAAAMRNVRNAPELSQRHRHRWNLPSDREANSEADTDEC